jgi:hypothetical protein
MLVPMWMLTRQGARKGTAGNNLRCLHSVNLRTCCSWLHWLSVLCTRPSIQTADSENGTLIGAAQVLLQKHEVSKVLPVRSCQVMTN